MWNGKNAVVKMHSNLRDLQFNHMFVQSAVYKHNNHKPKSI